MQSLASRAWTNDEASGRILVEGHHLPPCADPPLAGTIGIELKDIKKIADKKTGKNRVFSKGETKEDWSALLAMDDRVRFTTYDAIVIKVTALKYVGGGAKSKFIFGVLEFEFLCGSPTVDLLAVSVCKTEQTKLDGMIKDRYYTGNIQCRF